MVKRKGRMVKTMTYLTLMLMMSLIWIWHGKCSTSRGLLLTNTQLIQWRKLIFSLPLLKSPSREVTFLSHFTSVTSRFLISDRLIFCLCLFNNAEDIESSLSDYKKALSILERLVEPDSRHITELYPLISLSFFLLCILLIVYMNLT